jgi:hypothetical protein
MWRRVAGLSRRRKGNRKVPINEGINGKKPHQRMIKDEPGELCKQGLKIR